jgi:hypothetical protein
VRATAVTGGWVGTSGQRAGRVRDEGDYLGLLKDLANRRDSVPPGTVRADGHALLDLLPAHATIFRPLRTASDACRELCVEDMDSYRTFMFALAVERSLLSPPQPWPEAYIARTGTGVAPPPPGPLPGRGHFQRTGTWR